MSNTPQHQNSASSSLLPNEHVPWILIKGPLYEADDFTYYVDRKTIEQLGKDVLGSDPSAKDWQGYEGTVVLLAPAAALGSGQATQEQYKANPKAYQLAQGRACIVSCRHGEQYAITLRRDDKVKSAKELDSWKKKQVIPSQKPKEASKPVKPPVEVKLPGNGYAIPSKSLADQFQKLLFHGDSHATGLIVIAGSTGCGKTTVLYDLIRQILTSEGKGDLNSKSWPEVPPHFVTLEDPIEEPQFADWDPKESGIFYTPRSLVGWSHRKDSFAQQEIAQAGDCPKLAIGLKNALRQTPNLFLVGEMRTREDWKDLIQFAGTGHLAITTMHAGSLVEAFEIIMTAMAAKTPVERGIVAERLLGVIHLASVKIPWWPEGIAPDARKFAGFIDKKYKVTLPTLWRRTTKGVAALVADGLASVIPSRPQGRLNDLGDHRGRKQVEQTYCFSSAWLLEQLRATLPPLLGEQDQSWKDALRASPDQSKPHANVLHTLYRAFWTEVRSQALNHDLTIL